LCGGGLPAGGFSEGGRDYSIDEFRELAAGVRERLPHVWEPLPPVLTIAAIKIFPIPLRDADNPIDAVVWAAMEVGATHGPVDKRDVILKAVTGKQLLWRQAVEAVDICICIDIFATAFPDGWITVNTHCLP